jgi:hypothetical protein
MHRLRVPFFFFAAPLQAATSNMQTTPPPTFLSNLKHVDFVYRTCSGEQSSLRVPRETTASSLIPNASAYATYLKPYTLCNQPANFQTELSKACSDWAVYRSSVTEEWGFFLFFYFIALFFFFYFIGPKSIPHYRLNTNFSTPVSRLPSFPSRSFPLFPIITILYESVYPLFTNENFPVKMLPLFLVEGLRRKWDCRLNFAGLLEYSNLQKVVGNSVHTRLPFLGARATTDLYQKLNSPFGIELLDNSLRIRTELLKGNRITFSLRDFNAINSLAHQKRAEVSKAPPCKQLGPDFSTV